MPNQQKIKYSFKINNLKKVYKFLELIVFINEKDEWYSLLEDKNRLKGIIGRIKENADSTIENHFVETQNLAGDGENNTDSKDEEVVMVDHKDNDDEIAGDNSLKSSGKVNFSQPKSVSKQEQIQQNVEIQDVCVYVLDLLIRSILNGEYYHKDANQIFNSFEKLINPIREFNGVNYIAFSILYYTKVFNCFNHNLNDFQNKKHKRLFSDNLISDAKEFKPDCPQVDHDNLLEVRFWMFFFFLQLSYYESDYVSSDIHLQKLLKLRDQYIRHPKIRKNDNSINNHFDKFFLNKCEFLISKIIKRSHENKLPYIDVPLKEDNPLSQWADKYSSGYDKVIVNDTIIQDINSLDIKSYEFHKFHETGKRIKKYVKIQLDNYTRNNKKNDDFKKNESKIRHKLTEIIGFLNDKQEKEEEEEDLFDAYSSRSLKYFFENIKFYFDAYCFQICLNKKIDTYEKYYNFLNQNLIQLEKTKNENFHFSLYYLTVFEKFIDTINNNISNIYNSEDSSKHVDVTDKLIHNIFSLFEKLAKLKHNSLIEKNLAPSYVMPLYAPKNYCFCEYKLDIDTSENISLFVDSSFIRPTDYNELKQKVHDLFNLIYREINILSLINDKKSVESRISISKNEIDTKFRKNQVELIQIIGIYAALISLVIGTTTATFKFEKLENLLIVFVFLVLALSLFVFLLKYLFIDAKKSNKYYTGDNLVFMLFAISAMVVILVILYTNS